MNEIIIIGGETMKKKNKAYLIAEILLNRQLPLHVIKEITDVTEEDLYMLQTKKKIEQK